MGDLPALAVPVTEVTRYLATGVIHSGLDAGKRVFHVSTTTSGGRGKPRPSSTGNRQSLPGTSSLPTFAGYQTQRGAYVKPDRNYLPQQRNTLLALLATATPPSILVNRLL